MAYRRRSEKKQYSLEEIQEASRGRRLISPEVIINSIMMCFRAKQQDRLSAILDQVKIAKSSNNTTWLKATAKEATLLQFHDHQWIDNNIYRLDRKPKSTSKDTYSKEPSRDIRLTTEPGIQRIVEYAAETNTLAVSTFVTCQKTHPDISDSSNVAASRPTLELYPDIDIEIQEDCSLGVRSSTTSMLSVPSEVSGYHQSPVASRSTVRTSSNQISRLIVTSNRTSREVYQPQDNSSIERFTRNRRILCPVPGCKDDNNYPKIHAFCFHLPAIFDEHHDVQSISKRRIYALKLVTTWILGAVATISDLARYVTSMNLLHRDNNTEISGPQECMMREFCRQMPITIPEEFTLYPLSSPACLIHWRPLLLIVAQLERNERVELYKLFGGPRSNSSPHQEHEVLVPTIQLPEAFDSHFHLDRTRAALKLHYLADLDVICDNLSPNEMKVKLTGSVASFCDPANYPSDEEIASLNEKGVCITIGIHPKSADSITSRELHEFNRLACLPEVVGIGEIGLDRTVSPHMWHYQQKIVDIAVKRLKEDHVLIIHCRPIPGYSSTDTYMSLLYQLKCSVRRQQPMHVHCFTGDVFVMKNWLESFPRSYFGYTKMTENFNDGQLEALRSMDEDRILLETDSPYFPFPGCRFSTPSFIGMVAEVVAGMKEISTNHLLEISTANAKKLYQDS